MARFICNEKLSLYSLDSMFKETTKIIYMNYILSFCRGKTKVWELMLIKIWLNWGNRLIVDCFHFFTWIWWFDVHAHTYWWLNKKISLDCSVQRGGTIKAVYICIRTDEQMSYSPWTLKLQDILTIKGYRRAGKVRWSSDLVMPFSSDGVMGFKVVVKSPNIPNLANFIPHCIWKDIDRYYTWRNN